MAISSIGRRGLMAGVAGGMLAAGTARAQSPTRGGALTVGLANDAKTYDPIFSVQYTERYVLYLVFDTLVKYGDELLHQAGAGGKLGDVGRWQANCVRVAAGREVPGRHGVRCGGGEVEHRPAPGPKGQFAAAGGVGTNHRLGGRD